MAANNNPSSANSGSYQAENARGPDATAVVGSPDYSEMIREVLDPLIPSGATIALFDFPNHPNVGDSAIWLGEETYLRARKDLRIVVVDASNAQYRRLPRLSDSTVILIHGGGNLGDLWPQHQALREKLVANYPHHRIIQLPQSIHFVDANNQDRCRRVFSGHRDFHLLVRDRVSFDYGHQLHDGPTIMCTDMALCLGRLPRSGSVAQHGIVGLLRTDKERVTDRTNLAPATDLVTADWLEESDSIAKRITLRVETLQARYPRRLSLLYAIKPPLYHRLAMERLRRGCDILGSGQVVLTDRLHGHILCTLMGIPHVVLDNSYRKIGNFRDVWHTGAGLCEPATSLAEAQIKAQNLLHASGPSRTP